MKNLSERLSSLYLTSILLICVILWLLWGMALDGIASYAEGFNTMNRILIRDWLVSDIPGSGLLKSWFLGFCVIMFFLGMNLASSLWTHFTRLLRIRCSRPRFFLFFAHVFFGLVALAHLGSFMIGFRYENIDLRVGQTYEFEERYAVKMTEVHFVDDPGVLGKGRKKLKPDEFHYKDNYAEVAFFDRGREVSRERIFWLRPLKYKDIRATLKKFTPPPKEAGNHASDRSPGISCVISRNPFLGVFLYVFPLMLLVMIIFLVETWRPLSERGLDRVAPVETGERNSDFEE